MWLTRPSVNDNVKVYQKKLNYTISTECSTLKKVEWILT